MKKPILFLFLLFSVLVITSGESVIPDLPEKSTSIQGVVNSKFIGYLNQNADKFINSISLGGRNMTVEDVIKYFKLTEYQTTVTRKKGLHAEDNDIITTELVSAKTRVIVDKVDGTELSCLILLKTEDSSLSFNAVSVGMEKKVICDYLGYDYQLYQSYDTYGMENYYIGRWGCGLQFLHNTLVSIDFECFPGPVTYFV